METEQLSSKQLTDSKKTIAQANSLMDMMKTLRKKIHLNPGCGQRYLQKINPDLAQLQQAERELTASFSGTPQKSQMSSSKSKTELLNNMVRRGQA